MSDPRLRTLDRADPDDIEKARAEYANISTTIDDTVDRLTKIVDAGSDGLRGEWVEPLKEDAEKIRDSLRKAAVRYKDVAVEIKRYQPELDTAKADVDEARREEGAAENAQVKADGMPDPQRDADGEFSEEELEKRAAKEKAQNAADASLAKARNKLTEALDALDVAGKRFGDAVNEKRYNDGLSDTLKDKINAVMKIISKIFGIIAMVLGVLAIFIPGLNFLLLAGVVAGAVALVADITLLAHGEGSVLDVVMGVVGLGLAGLGAIASLIGKNMSLAARNLGNLTGRPNPIGTHPPQLNFVGGRPGSIELGNLGPGGRSVYVTQRTTPGDFPVPSNPATNWKNTADWFNGVPGMNWVLGKTGAVLPEFGFWKSFTMQWNDVVGMWKGLLTNPGQFAKDWAGVIGGLSGYRDLAATIGAIGGNISPLWAIWGGVNGGFTLGNLIYAGGRQEEWIPDVNINSN